MDKDYKEDPIKVLRFNEANGFYTTPERSKNMSKIKGKNNKPEEIFRRELWKNGIRYRKNVKKFPGNPDILLRKYRLAIFIDGEFWHGYNWKEKREKIKTNRDFWIPKIERNMQRDREINNILKLNGYKVIRFWDTDIKKNLQNCVNIIKEYINAEHIPNSLII